MRNVDRIADRLETTLQTIDNNANPGTFLRIRRYDVPLHEKPFIEKSRIVNREGLTDSDIAVCHPFFGRDNTEMWVAYVRQGILHIKYANNHEVMTRSEWNDYSFTADAEACAIAFNSKVKHNVRDMWEFITEEVPWVFWVHDGQLKAKLCTPLGVYEHELAVANVTDVSAVRGPAADSGNWDLGLTVFFLMAGSVYYRQYINGEWCDAELVPGLSELNIVSIKAFNTWDYRVGLQLLTDSGDLYEYFTYTEGIGVRGTEHLEINAEAVGKLYRIGYDGGYTNEHLNISATALGNRIYGLSAVPISAENINVSGDYGKKVEVTMDYPTTEGEVEEFILKDDSNNVYACENIEHDGNIIRLTFVNFNMAYNSAYLQVIYTKGTMMSPVVLTESFTKTFVPTGLSAPSTPAPRVSSIYNV